VIVRKLFTTNALLALLALLTLLALLPLIVVSLAAWGSWSYRLPDPRVDIAPVVRIFAGTEELAVFQHEARRSQLWVPLSGFPRVVLDAVRAAEDRRFFEHHGVDLRAILRAARANLRSAGAVQGASTITQQLARTLFLGTGRSWARKVRETVIAAILELRYDKNRILEAYLNSVYMGHDGNVAVHGIAAAARHFLGKELTAIRPDEAAFLAAAIRAPNRVLSADAAQARALRDPVLRAMAEEGSLSEAATRTAMARPVSRRTVKASGGAAYFVDVTREEIGRRMKLPTGGEVRIATTLDLALQAVAESAVRDGLEGLERRRRLPPKTLQAALVAIEPASGKIRALVGGRSYLESPFNRATRAQRQPGSLFKPLVYLAAFEAQPHSGTSPLTPASLIRDEPIAIPTANGDWRPRNIDGQFHGLVTVRRALQDSLNVPAARIAQETGLNRVIQVARAVGIESRLSPVPSLALGTSEVNLLEITEAFATIANGGLMVRPTTLDTDGASGTGVTVTELPPPVRVVSPESAFLITHLLRGVMQDGTGSASARWGLREITAGKTGTTDGLKDSWFVGYTPDLVVGVWVGTDDASPIELTGSEAALPIWASVVQAVVRRSPSRAFAPPAGVVLAQVDRDTGLRASSWCGSVATVTEAFRTGTEPQAECAGPSQAGVGKRLVGWLERLFR